MKEACRKVLQVHLFNRESLLQTLLLDYQELPDNIQSNIKPGQIWAYGFAVTSSLLFRGSIVNRSNKATISSRYPPSIYADLSSFMVEHDLSTSLWTSNLEDATINCLQASGQIKHELFEYLSSFCAFLYAFSPPQLQDYKAVRLSDNSDLHFMNLAEDQVPNDEAPTAPATLVNTTVTNNSSASAIMAAVGNNSTATLITLLNQLNMPTPTAPASGDTTTIDNISSTTTAAAVAQAPLPILLVDPSNTISN